ncbi:MAG TPA: hypothetical protein VIQ54_11375 [Polyangia bacterium]
MTESDVLKLAKETAAREGWPWQEPVHVGRHRTWLLFGRLRWHVMTFADHRGRNVNVHIDDRTGSVIAKGFARR